MGETAGWDIHISFNICCEILVGRIASHSYNLVITASTHAIRHIGERLLSPPVLFQSP
jgi:hypothetical protein